MTNPSNPAKKAVELTLVENARSFVVEALAKAVAAETDSAQWKFAILHVVQAIELSLKELLKQQHPVLIYRNVDKPGDFTVSLEGALARLKNVASFEPTADELKALQFATKVRNEIVHHEFKADPAELKPAFARLFGFLVDFHRDHCDFALDDKVPRRLWLDGVGIKDYGEELFKRAQVRIKADQAEDGITNCPKCGWKALSGTGDRAGKCYVCQHMTELCVCDRCNAIVLTAEGFEHGERKFCPSCIEYVTADYWRDSATEER
jgi:hypothetical protein